MTSPPADRYAAARRRAASERTGLGQLRGLLEFELDDFQVRACEAIESGHSVLVAAPTGSGKTVVGEFAVHLALATGRKAFYTTPIKALSNQKYRDLAARYGREHVGLLTGDNSINGEAPIVVMTTEVLRNMLYAGSASLRGLGWAVMDEVHYLADRERGPVWEEVILHLPESVSVVALSATVSNAEEFGAWLHEVRGDTEVVVEERRPVPLHQHVLAQGRLIDLFDSGESGPDQAGKVNPKLRELAAESARRYRSGPDSSRGRGRGRPGAGRGRPLSRPDALELLERRGLLPAIVFVFSRAGCDAAVAQCLASGLRLSSARDRAEIREFAEQRCSDLADSELPVLGYYEWLDGLERGIAAHHAGMLPVFKETVEELFAAGLIKAVFATETLALGINMPARSVVLERLVKWNGKVHADITAGEYTQLTGRAGRRGIDVEGHAVVAWHDSLDPAALAGLASTRTYPLRSSFRPSYNMAVNLVERMGRVRAREVLETSFAQFQADRAVVGLAAQLRRQEEALTGYADAMRCHLGDFAEYAALRRQLSDAEKATARAAADLRRSAARASLEQLRPGDVIVVPAGRRSGPAVVLQVQDFGHGDFRPLVLGVDRRVRRLSAVDVPAAVEPVLHLRIPRNFEHRNAAARRDLARALLDATAGLERGQRTARRGSASSAADEAEIARLRALLRSHPCHGCDERELHARWAERYYRLLDETNRLSRRVRNRTSSIARQFDQVCQVLADLGYLSSPGDDAVVTDQGHQLARLYSEQDLLAAECLRAGMWADLDPAELAAVTSALVFESRSAEPAERPALPASAAARLALADLAERATDLAEIEERAGLTFVREPDPGFARAVHSWANGRRLDQVLRESELAPGDFVRWTRQVIDLLGQIAEAASRAAAPAGAPGQSQLARTARLAADSLRRGVVASLVPDDSG